MRRKYLGSWIWLKNISFRSSKESYTGIRVSMRTKWLFLPTGFPTKLGLTPKLAYSITKPKWFDSNFTFHSISCNITHENIIAHVHGCWDNGLFLRGTPAGKFVWLICCVPGLASNSFYESEFGPTIHPSATLSRFPLKFNGSWGTSPK